MINTSIPNFANAVSPFSPLGKQPVGEESSDGRTSPLKPVEESAESARLENRRGFDQHRGEVEQGQRATQTRGGDREDHLEAAGPVAEAQQGSAEESESQKHKKQIEHKEQQQIRELAARDREVRAHEQAHAGLGGQFAGAPQYTFERGPDGVNYAVGGEVSIDTGKIANNAEASIEKARTVRRAALAPADPSPQDRRVAALATQIELEARTELRQQAQQKEELQKEELQKEELQQAERENQVRERQAQESREAGVADRADGETEAEEREESVQTVAERFAEINRLNQAFNRRLVDIGVVISSSPSGGLFDQTV
ncbi:MAG: putative metalloprotease CJM1_0395 family protein [Exilibacterium sp.]